MAGHVWKARVPFKWDTLDCGNPPFTCKIVYRNSSRYVTVQMSSIRPSRFVQKLPGLGWGDPERLFPGDVMWATDKGQIAGPRSIAPSFVQSFEEKGSGSLLVGFQTVLEMGRREISGLGVNRTHFRYMYVALLTRRDQPRRL